MNLSIFNFKPIKWTLIFLLIMVAVVGSFKSWSIQQADQRLRPLSPQFWVDKIHTRERFDMIIIGDSRVYRGISPSAIEERLPTISVFNFGFSSAGLNNLLLKAGESKLLAGGKKIIILGVTPYSLTRSAALNEEYKQFKKFLPWPYHVPILKLFLSPKETIWSITRFFVNEKIKYYQIIHKNGWVESNQFPEDERSGLDQYNKRLTKEKISKEVLKEMLVQVSIWKQEGYTVFAFRPPASMEMEKLENDKSGFEESLIKEEFNKAGGIWIDIEDRYQYRTYDGSHLNSDSAIRLSKFIAGYIADTAGLLP